MGVASVTLRPEHPAKSAVLSHQIPAPKKRVLPNLHSTALCMQFPQACHSSRGHGNSRCGSAAGLTQGPWVRGAMGLLEPGKAPLTSQVTYTSSPPQAAPPAAGSPEAARRPPAVWALQLHWPQTGPQCPGGPGRAEFNTIRGLGFLGWALLHLGA